MNIFPYGRQEICILLVNTMAADDLAMQGTRTSAGLVLIYICRNIPVRALLGLTFGVFCLNVYANPI